mgnify:FL=1
MKKIDFLTLKMMNQPYRADILNAITKVVDSGWYIQGEEVT